MDGAARVQPGPFHDSGIYTLFALPAGDVHDGHPGGCRADDLGRGALDTLSEGLQAPAPRPHRGLRVSGRGLVDKRRRPVPLRRERDRSRPPPFRLPPFRLPPFRLPPFRLAHLVGLIFWAAVLLVFVSGGWEREGVWLVLVRNLLGLSGMAFLAAYVAGGGLSWILPVGFAVALPFIGKTPGEKWFWWAWTERPAEEPLSWLLAFSLLAAGMGVVSFFGAREAVDEIG